MIDDNSEHRKAKGAIRNVVETIIHNECEDVLFNNKCLRHSMNNRIQSKYQRMGTYEINKISLSCFHDKIYIYIQNNGYDRLALGY